jgi:NAD(P)-dependent dehydrogenase (short-subunit alcohol dehydrogenase family)
MSRMELDGDVAVITGAGRGIGRAIALAYAEEGAKLVLAARTLEELEETADQTRGMGAETLVIRTDVANRKEVNGMVREALNRFSSIDVLVNNAGILGPIGPLQDNDVDRWIQTVQVNLIGTYLCCQAVVPTMVQNRRGKIINLFGGGMDRGHPGMSAYGTTKGGIMRLTDILSSELGDQNVQVNAMSPIGVNTRIFEETRDAANEAGITQLFEYAQRVTSGGGTPVEKVAQLAVFLGGRSSATLTGRIFSTNDDISTISNRIPQIMASNEFTFMRVESS